MSPIERAEQILTASPNTFMYRTDLAQRIGICLNSLQKIVVALRLKYGNKFVERTRPGGKNGLVVYALFDSEPDDKLDLFRGWRHPVTGYQPPRLGLDQ